LRSVLRRQHAHLSRARAIYDVRGYHGRWRRHRFAVKQCGKYSADSTRPRTRYARPPWHWSCRTWLFASALVEIIATRPTQRPRPRDGGFSLWFFAWWRDQTTTAVGNELAPEADFGTLRYST